MSSIVGRAENKIRNFSIDINIIIKYNVKFYSEPFCLKSFSCGSLLKNVPADSTWQCGVRVLVVGRTFLLVQSLSIFTFVFYAVCRPQEECADITSELATSHLEPGFVAHLDNSGCCPFVNKTCQPSTCPSHECPEFQTPVKKGDGVCCPIYACGKHLYNTLSEPEINYCSFLTLTSLSVFFVERKLL